MAKHIPHLFFSEEEIENRKLSGENFNHLVNVLRMKETDEFIVLDNKGNKLECIINEIQKNSAIFGIQKITNNPKPFLDIVLVQAVTKFEAFEEILDKSTQLGATEIIPMFAENSTISKDLFRKKFQRFKKILKSASEQSKRIFLPELTEPVTFNEFVEQFPVENTIVAYENANLSMKEYFKNNRDKSKIIFVCGPEGGFSEREIELFKEKNYPLIRLCSPVLRAETASIVGIGNIIYELEII